MNQVIAGLAKYTSRNGEFVSVLGKAQTAAHEGEIIERDGFSVTVYTRWSRAYRAAVHKAIDAAEVVHLHGTYSPLNIWLGRICELYKTPYVVTLHGGLSVARNTWKNRLQKLLFHWLFQKRHLERSALIQALTEEESTEALDRFKPRAMCVIPNGIDLEDFPYLPSKREIGSSISVGYIGRISREKNLDALCDAFSNINVDGRMKLFLAGPVSPEAEELACKYSSLGVELIGPKYGSEKRNFFNSIDLFVQPSKADVFSIAAMEALAMGVPMVISRTSDASHFASTGAFVLCEPTAFGIERALRKTLARRSDWPEMVQRGRQLIETRLNWNAASSDLLMAYRKIQEP